MSSIIILIFPLLIILLIFAHPSLGGWPSLEGYQNSGKKEKCTCLADLIKELTGQLKAAYNARDNVDQNSALKTICENTLQDKVTGETTTIKLENEFEIHFTHYEGSYKPTDFDESDWDTPFSIFKRKLEYAINEYTTNVEGRCQIGVLYAPAIGFLAELDRNYNVGTGLHNQLREAGFFN